MGMFQSMIIALLAMSESRHLYFSISYLSKVP